MNELDCPPTDIAVTPLGAGGYRVDACGRHATFSCLRHEAWEGNGLIKFRRMKDTCTREESWSQ